MNADIGNSGGAKRRAWRPYAQGAGSTRRADGLVIGEVLGPFLDAAKRERKVTAGRRYGI